jgi:hypothetical protein
LIDSKCLFLSSYDVISHSYMLGCYRVTVNLVVPLTGLAALNASYTRALWGGGCGIYGGCLSKTMALMGSLRHWMYGSLV